MAHVLIEIDLVVGVFARPQPQLEGYQEIPDDDARITAFLASQGE